MRLAEGEARELERKKQEAEAEKERVRKEIESQKEQSEAAVSDGCHYYICQGSAQEFLSSGLRLT